MFMGMKLTGEKPCGVMIVLPRVHEEKDYWGQQQNLNWCVDVCSWVKINNGWIYKGVQDLERGCKR